MDAKTYQEHDALGLAKLVKDGTHTPTDLLHEAIRRTEQDNPSINAIVIRLDDQATDQLENLPNGPFRGVPFLLKDLHVALAGAPLTNGSRSFVDQVPTHDSYITEKYRRAGLTIFGRSASPELGLTTATESVLYGVTRNPWNLDYTSGGSSGGASAAVAMGILPAAHASDGGGSIRIPASCCGLFGFKPSRGMVSPAPESGEGWAGLSTNHAVTRSVRDSAALLDAVAGNAAGDPYAAPQHSGALLAELDKPNHALNIAVTTTPFTDTATHADCVEATKQAADLCASLGHSVTWQHPKLDIKALGNAARVIVAVNVAQTLGFRAEELGRELTEDDVEPVTWANLQAAERYTALDYLNAIQTIHQVGRSLGNFLQRFDVLLSPTMPAPPQKVGALALDHSNFSEYLVNLKNTLGFTQLFNISGGPAMSVPLAWGSKGLPIGVQFGAALGGEARLFRLAGQLEAAQPWFHRRPDSPSQQQL